MDVEALQGHGEPPEDCRHTAEVRRTLCQRQTPQTFMEIPLYNDNDSISQVGLEGERHARGS